MAEDGLLFLSADDMSEAADMAQAIDWMRGAFEQVSSGEATVPIRMNMGMPEQRGELLLMPVHLPREKRIGAKTVAVFGGNPSRNLPLIQSLMMVWDGETGRPLAVMDGAWLTALRTGAASGLATQLCAQEDASVAAIFGAGTQARTQLEAVTAIRPIEKVLVFNRNRENAEIFCQEMSARLQLEVCPARSPADLAQAQVLCTATLATRPLFSPEHVRPGAHINAIGAYRPDMVEIPAELVAQARLFVDERKACLEEAGDLMQPIASGLISPEHVVAELGDLCAGTVPARTGPEQITLFKSVGNAAQDLAAAAAILDVAQARGLGTRVNM